MEIITEHFSSIALALLASASIIGWVKMLVNGVDPIDAHEQKRLEKERVAYRKRYKVDPPR